MPISRSQKVDDLARRVYRRFERRAEDAIFVLVLVGSALLFAWFIEIVVLG